MTKIKLCGLMRPEDVDAANALMPDYVGFVFAKKSRRALTPQAAQALRARLRPGIRAVGVFVREDPKQIAALYASGVIDLCQLHGGEDADYISALRALCDVPILHAFRVDGPEDLRIAADSPADGVLLDHGAGGTGDAFDWSLLDGFKRPYFLAGGLSPDNVACAVRTLRPYAVDVSSGIETDGHKDPDRMRAFVSAVRASCGKEDAHA